MIIQKDVDKNLFFNLFVITLKNTEITHAGNTQAIRQNS